MTYIDKTCTHINRKKILVCFLRSKCLGEQRLSKRNEIKIQTLLIFNLKNGYSSRFTYIGIKKKNKTLSLYCRQNLTKFFFAFEMCWTDLESFFRLFQKFHRKIIVHPCSLRYRYFFLHYRPITEYRKNSWYLVGLSKIVFESIGSQACFYLILKIMNFWEINI